MYGHDHTYESESSLRPKPSRLDESESALAMNAALAGRLDAAGPAGVVGLQRAAGNAGTASLLEEERSPVHDVVGSGGAPLEPGLRADMEGRFGQDFGDVRIHNDDAAHQSAKSVNAQAYTVGSNIVFQRDKYDPGSEAGKHMLAHELTHVVQQRSGPVDGTDAGGGVKVSDPSDRFERDAVANADQVMSAPAPAAMPGGSSANERRWRSGAARRGPRGREADGADLRSTRGRRSRRRVKGSPHDRVGSCDAGDRRRARRGATQGRQHPSPRGVRTAFSGCNVWLEMPQSTRCSPRKSSPRAGRLLAKSTRRYANCAATTRRSTLWRRA